MEPRNRAGTTKQNPGQQAVDEQPKKSSSSIWGKMTGWLDKLDDKLTGGPTSNGGNSKFNVAYKPKTNNVAQSEIISSKNPLPKHQ